MTTFPRRFYQQVTVIAAPGGWQITLDGKVLRSPAKADFILPTAALADAIRDEWDAQVEQIRPSSMPMMQLASTAVDRVGPHRAQIVADSAGYAASDLICYRSDTPEQLVQRQTEIWQPLLDWANHRFDTALQATTGIVAIAQPESSLARYRQVVETFDPWRLSAIANLTGLTGSLIIALALIEQRLTPMEAIAAAQLDETFQAERWGEDAEAAERRQGLAREINETATYLALLAGD
jgi:chaperone required for assembly of F1-ATPase